MNYVYNKHWVCIWLQHLLLSYRFSAGMYAHNQQGRNLRPTSIYLGVRFEKIVTEFYKCRLLHIETNSRLEPTTAWREKEHHQLSSSQLPTELAKSHTCPMFYMLRNKRAFLYHNFVYRIAPSLKASKGMKYSRRLREYSLHQQKMQFSFFRSQTI